MTTKSITKQTVLAAAKRKYGKNVQLTWLKANTSEAQRQAARAKCDQLKAERDELTATLKAAKDVDRELRKAARFVADTDADPTAMEAMRTALVAAERYHAMLADRKQIETELNATRGLTYRKKYHLGRIEGVGGIRFNSVKEEADTLAELYELLTP